MIKRYIVMIVIFISLPAVLAEASRQNDNFADREGISGHIGSTTGVNVLAIKESGEPNHAGNPGGASVWWSWTAPVSATVSFATFGSNFNTLLAVYTGSSVNELTLVVANDNFVNVFLGDNSQSLVQFAAQAGTTYHIAVDGFNGITGAIALSWSVHLTGDNFADRIVIQEAAGLVTGPNVQATKENGEPNHAGKPGGRSVWWSWTAPVSATAIFTTLSSNFDTLLAVYTGSSVNGLTRVVANDDIIPFFVFQSRVVFEAQAGTTYHIAVDGFSGATGTVVLSWTVTIPNDNFIDAIPLNGVSGTITGANVAKGSVLTLMTTTKENGEPDHAGNPGGTSVWWSWTAPVSARVAFDTHGSDFDTLLAVYTGTGVSNLTEVVSNDQACNSDQSKVVFEAQAGTTYHIAVDGYFGVAGAIVLNWNIDDPTLAILGERLSGGRGQVELRSAVSGIREDRVSTSAGFVPRALTTISCLSGIPNPVLAVLGENSNGQGQVELRDAVTGVQQGIVPMKAGLVPLALSTLNELAGASNNPVLAALGTRQSDGRGRIELRDAVDGSLLATIAVSAALTPVALAVVEDLPGQPHPVLAILGTRQSNGRGRVELRDAVDGSLLATIGVSAALTPVALAVVEDLPGQPHPVLAILGIRQSNGRGRIELRDAVDGSLLATIGVSAALTPVALAVVADLPGQPHPALAILGTRQSNGRGRVELRDAVNGTLLAINEVSATFEPLSLAVLD